MVERESRGVRKAQSREPHRRTARPRLTPAALARKAMEQLCGLTGREADTVSGLEHTDEGWRLQVEVVELERIPQSTSVLASYEVMVDDRGELIRYERTRRYFRNQAGDS